MRLAWPIFIGQISFVLIGFGDVVVAGHYSTSAVAAIGVANGLINPFFIFGVGLIAAVSPYLSIERGKGSFTRGQRLLSICVFCLLVSALVVLGLMVLNEIFLESLGLNQELVPYIQRYNRIVVWSLPFGLLYAGIKEYYQSFEEVKVPNVLVFVAVFVNIVLNWVFTLGIEGVYDGIGFDGLAIASFGVRLFIFLAILFYARGEFIRTLDWTYIKNLFRFSLPVGLSYFFEVFAFCLVSILSGMLTVTSAAANNIVITISSVTFMLPFSLSSAVAVRVGESFGKCDADELARRASASFGLGTVIAICISLFYLIFGSWSAKIMGQNAEVTSLASSVFVLVAVFQLSDSFQVILSGVLRGMELARQSLGLVFAGYWIMGIPLGIYLCFGLNQGILGLWKGLGVALSIVALALYLYYFKKLSLLKQQFHDRSGSFL